MATFVRQTVARTAKVSKTNRSQAVRPPKEYQFSKPRDWGPYLERVSVASEAFMNDVKDLPVQERQG